MSSKTIEPTPVTLAAAGVYGFEAIESVVLASLITADPLLLIGSCGTGKTLLLNRLSEALDLDHRHYNASLVSFDDFVGFPFPDEERTSIRYLQTPATVWGAESVLVDEISRCKPEHQNKFFPLIQEKRIQGIKLDKLIYRWAAMNPCGLDDSRDMYDGSEPLDQALADRFAFVVEVPDWAEMSEETQRAIAAAGDSPLPTGFGPALRRRLKSWRAAYESLLAKPEDLTLEYCRVAAGELDRAGIRISPRRVRQMVKNVCALLSVRGGGSLPKREKTYEIALKWSLPGRAWGARPPEHLVRSVHRATWDAVTFDGTQKWLSEFHAEKRLPGKIEKLVKSCPDADTGTLAVTQLLAGEPPWRAAMFAYAVYPAALSGELPIGSEGVSEIGKAAVPVLNVCGSFTWRTDDPDAEHPDYYALQGVLDGMSGKRRERAAQLFNYLFVNGLAPEDPAAVEEELNQCVAGISNGRK